VRSRLRTPGKSFEKSGKVCRAAALQVKLKRAEIKGRSPRKSEQGGRRFGCVALMGLGEPPTSGRQLGHDPCSITAPRGRAPAVPVHSWAKRPRAGGGTRPSVSSREACRTWNSANPNLGRLSLRALSTVKTHPGQQLSMRIKKLVGSSIKKKSEGQIGLGRERYGTRNRAVSKGSTKKKGQGEERLGRRGGLLGGGKANRVVAPKGGKRIASA